MKKILLVLVPLLNIFGCGKSSAPLTEDHSGLNLDFEQVRPNNTPVRWILSKGKNYEFSPDSDIVFSGRRSLRITARAQEPAQREDAANAGSNIFIDDVRGKTVTLLGYIRTSGITDGSASLWLGAYGASGMLAADSMGSREVKGTSDWKQYKVELTVDTAATTVSFGAARDGSKGTAWFDKFVILVDGKPYEHKIFTLNADELDWLKHAAQPFKTTKAESGFDDLGSIQEIVGDAEVVGLGEATHGTKEFAEMKHRLVEYLAGNMGFTVFAAEANMPEAHRINDYIHGGSGNLRELMNAMGFYGINTKEVEVMIEWMRRYNQSGKGKIDFAGFDMQSGTLAAKNVIAFLKKNDPHYTDTSRITYDAVSVMKHMQNSDYHKTASQKEIDWAIQNANIVLQASHMGVLSGDYKYRDSCMAENARWIKDQAASGAKIILWAHNGHVAKSDEWRMGCHLNRLYGKKYCAIGFKFHEGTYTAWSEGKLSSSNVALSYDPGTLDWVFHSLGMPRFILNLQGTSASDPRSGWLHQKLETKDIGGMAEEGYIFQNVTDRWDAIIFFEMTSASESYFK